jgi:hypothetical protein
MSQIRIRIAGKDNVEPREQLNIWYYEGHHEIEPRDNPAVFKYDTFTDRVGNTGWPIPEWKAREFTCFVNTYNVRPRYGSVRAFLTPLADGSFPDYDLFVSETAAVQVPPEPISSLLPLHRDGTDIRTSDGRRYVHNQATNYLLFQRFLEGHDLSRLWYDGFDGYNVTFCMVIVPSQVGLRALRPENYDRFYERVDEFLTLAESKGKRIEVTALCDTRIMERDFEWQVRHTEALYDVLRSHAGIHLCQLANEPENGPNSVDYGRFQKPDGVFWSRGSSLAGQKCPLPAGDYSTAHLSRQGGGAYLDAQSFYMIEGYSGYEGTHGPCIVNETRGASNTENSDRRTTDPSYFRKIASAMRGWNGGTFHADFAIHSEACEPGTPQDACRLAFLEGIR